jgi:hypothetical protein
MNILISQKSAKKCKNIEKLDEKQTKKKYKKQLVFIEYKNDDYMYISRFRTWKVYYFSYHMKWFFS